MSSHFTFKAIGTTWNIDINENLSDEIVNIVMAEVKNRIETYEQNYSRFRKDSLITTISNKAGKYELPQDAEKLISLYRELYEITNGLVTPLIGQVLSDTGYDSNYTLKPKENIAPAKKWEDVITYSSPILTAKEPVLLDFGALGKGYCVDIVLEILIKHKINNFTVNAGGDIAYRSTQHKPLRVGLENPENFKQVVGVANIVNQSICGSAGNRRSWGKYHHIINPMSTESPKHILALWVVADSTILADGLSTALFFVSPLVLLKRFRFEYAIIFSNHEAHLSAGFPGEFFKE